MQIDLYNAVKAGEKYLPGKKATMQLTVDAFLDGVQNGRWEESVLNYRAGRLPKIGLPAATPSGTFSSRGASNLIQHSGVIVLDFDAKDNEVFPSDAIACDSYVYAFHKSVSGNGFAVYVRIEGDKHRESFEALEKYFADNYQVVLDQSGKDVSRMRYVSHDPDTFRNPQAKVFKKLLPKVGQHKQEPKYFIHTANDVEHVVNQLVYRGLNIAESYHDYIKVGMAFATHYGEGGRDYFHRVAGVSGKYTREHTDAKYINFLKSGRRSVTIASFFYMAKEAGCEIKTPRTQQIERVATMRAMSVGKPGGYLDKQQAKDAAKRILEEHDQISGGDVDEIIDQVFEVPQEQLKLDGKHQISELKEFLREFNLRGNVITGKTEYEGKPLNDRGVNSLYIKMLERFAGQKKNFSKDLMITLLESDFVQEYNPIRQFFQDNAHLRPMGNINKLLSSLRVGDMRFSSEGHRIWGGQQFLDVFLRKWLLSCIASWHGTYSVMMAVLTGAQAAGKTNFFRRLLPNELQDYYADNKMDRGNNDDLMLMCTKAIICDDEFSGKSKQDYKLLKEIISKQKVSIRRPYGRFSEDLVRIAVLCGCSNEEEVINDPTGNRRIIPIPVIEIDWEKYNAVDKVELWMELYHEWREIGDGWMLTKEEVRVLNDLTTKAQQVATEEEALWMFFQHPSDGGFVEYMTNTEIKNYIETNSRLHISGQKLGIYLANNGFERKARRMGTRVMYVWAVVKKSFIQNSGGL
jgi:hypothetical protein